MPHPLARISIKNSSQVLSYQYCPACQGLYVEFSGHHLYKYAQVTEAEWTSLRQAASKGSWIHRNLKATGRDYLYLGVDQPAGVSASAG